MPPFVSRLAPASLRTAAILAALTVCPFAAPPGAQNLPPARELVERHVQAIGGREAVASVRSILARGTFEMPAMGLRGRLHSVRSNSGAMLVRTEIPGLGEIVTAFDGEVGWATNPMIGPRLIQGAELAQMRDHASLIATLREPPAVRQLETTGISEVEGERCYRVRVTWTSGRQSHDCYSIDSGLLIGKELTQLSPTGALDVTLVYSDYRDFGRLRMPVVTVQRTAGQEQVLRVEEVEFDSVDTAAFRPPAEVTVLMERERSSRGRGAGGSR